jgi:hypothetical protein
VSNSVSPSIELFELTLPIFITLIEFIYLNPKPDAKPIKVRANIAGIRITNIELSIADRQIQNDYLKRRRWKYGHDEVGTF